MVACYGTVLVLIIQPMRAVAEEDRGGCSVGPNLFLIDSPISMPVLGP